MKPTARRLAVSGLAWSAGAAAAVTVSLVALSSINPDSASGPPQQLVPDSLTHAVAASSAAAPPDGDGVASPSSGASAPAPPAGSPARPGPSAGAVQRTLSSAGGTVVARCTGSSAYLVSWSPAQGYRVVHVERGPAVGVEVVFRDAAGRTRVEAEVRCLAGTPTLHDERGHSDHD